MCYKIKTYHELIKIEYFQYFINNKKADYDTICVIYNINIASSHSPICNNIIIVYYNLGILYTTYFLTKLDILKLLL